MAVIHGHSHKAIRYMRDEPATVSVYWIYCSRTNRDNVAWPSLRGLSRDTHWDEVTANNARGWLIEHEALELLWKPGLPEAQHYIRPEWRKLDPGVLKRKMSLDKSWYFRPTGFLKIGIMIYPLLYIPGDEAAEIDEGETGENNDVRPGRSSSPSNIDADDHRQGRTELGSSINLGSKESEDGTHPIPAAGAAPAVFDALRVFDVVAYKSFSIKDMNALKPVPPLKTNPTAKRIGKIKSWVMHHHPEGIDESALALRCAEFYKWWSGRYSGKNAPRDVTKFGENWLAWEQQAVAEPDLSKRKEYDEPASFEKQVDLEARRRAIEEALE